MPKTHTVLQVFVASPSDVGEERSALDGVIAELNATWSTKLGIAFDIIKWETHVRPGFSVDAQAVVNAQIPDNYDVFIGIFWTRAGTPTSRANSGSIEEFEKAYARHKATGSTPEIMIYFKEAPISPSKIDPQQFSTLQEFKASLPARGGLFFPFEDVSSFEASVRAHLAAVAQKFTSNPSDQTQELSTQLANSPASIIDNDELGLFDLIDLYTIRIRDLIAAMFAINDATVCIGENLTQRSSELPSQDEASDAYKRKIIKRASEDMLRYAEAIDVQLPAMSSAREEAFSALSRAIALMTDFETDPEEVRDLKNTLVGTMQSTASARPLVIGMKQAALGVPRISKDVNHAKRAVASSVDRFVTELDSVESTVSNIVESLDKLLEQLNKADGPQ